jgi:hypothetical protein
MYIQSYKLSLNLVVDKPRQINFNIRSVLSREPDLIFLYNPYILWSRLKRFNRGSNPNEAVVSQNTEILVDGFQGSANSFATQAFINSQSRYIYCSNHLHSATQIIQAKSLGIPILLLIREPIGTILSLTGRWPYISVNQGLQSYIGFYHKLKPHINYFVISSFSQTTQNLDQVINRVNSRFGTCFNSIDVVDAKAKYLSSKSRKSTRLNRQAFVKSEKKKDLMHEKNALLLSKANELYRIYESMSMQ